MSITQERTPRSSYNKSFFVSVACLTLVAAMVLLLLPSIFWSLLRGPDTFFEKQIYAFSSPDNRYEITVSRSVNFPTFDPFEPPTTVTIAIKNAGATREFSYVRFEIHDYNELTRPEITWTTSEVNIEKVDSHMQFSFKFRLRE